MRAVVQRAQQASVKVDDTVVGSIEQGLVVFLGVGHEDGHEDVRFLAEKIANLRVFEDAQGKMNRSLLELKGQMLIVSQFTLLGDCRKGRRPSFSQAAKPEQAQQLYSAFVEHVRSLGISTGEGVFQAHMQVDLINDGPVTLLLDSKGAF